MLWKEDRMTPIDFQGERVQVKVTMDNYGNIETWLE